MRRFPVALTLVVTAAMAVLIALGVWQLQRLTWKRALLAKIAALHDAPAIPIAAALARGSGAADFIRVSTVCAPAARPSPMVFRYSLRDGQVGWRLISLCRLATGPYGEIVVDRGLVGRFAGKMAPGAVHFPEPGEITGVLRAAPRAPKIGVTPPDFSRGVQPLTEIDQSTLQDLSASVGGATVAPYLLAVESESPPVQGVRPAALPEDIPNNHFVYAMTWFGLAAGLASVYGAFVWRRIRGG